LVDAVTFLVMGLAVGALNVRREPTKSTDESADDGSGESGLALLRRDSSLRLVVAVLVTMVLAASMVDVAEVFFVKGVLHAGDAGYGALMAAWGAGIALGVVLLARRLEDAPLVPAVLTAAAVVNVAYLVAAGTTDLTIAMVAFFAGGIANGLGLVAVRTLLQRRSPEEMRGRIFAAYGALVTGAQLVAFALGGAVTSLIGARSTLVLAAACGIAVVVVGSVVYGRTAPDRVVSAV
jgi:predicted MFS family arabinose efflux permease